jgi:hypothetical protein
LVAQYPNAILKKIKSPEINEYTLTNLMNTMYKIHSKSVDWIIIAKTDEFIYSKDITKKLRRHQQLGATILKPRQFEMVSNETPTTDKQIYDVCKEGVCFVEESKPIIFLSTLSINLSIDRKGCNPDPVTQARVSESDIVNLHYSKLGIANYLNKVHKYQKNLSDISKKNNWYPKYNKTDKELITEFTQLAEQAKVIKPFGGTEW